MITVKCTCNPELMNDQVARFANQVVVELPDWSGDYQWRAAEGYPTTACIDPCIVDAVKELWLHGIETNGCCCGHNVMQPWAGIIKEDFQRALEMGYKQKPVDPITGHSKNTIYLNTAEPNELNTKPINMTTLEIKIKQCLIEFHRGGDIEIAITDIKESFTEELPETYDEQGNAKTAQQYLTEIEKLLK